MILDNDDLKERTNLKANKSRRSLEDGEIKNILNGNLKGERQKEKETKMNVDDSRESTKYVNNDDLRNGKETDKNKDQIDARNVKTERNENVKKEKVTSIIDINITKVDT